MSDSHLELPADALLEWVRISEAVLRGVAHSLNNRATALSAVVELSRGGGDDPSAARSILWTELERMREVIRVTQVLGPLQETVTSFAPRDAIEDAFVVARLHEEQHEANY